MSNLQTTRLEPPEELTPKRDRIAALDALRGFALCGIIFVNIPQTLEMYRSVAELPEGMRLMVIGRFYPMFYLLFGIGFGLFLRSAARRVDRPRAALLRRFLALAAFGGLHHLLQPGEVLLPFAITGLLVLLPLSYLPARVNLAAGAVLTLAGLLSGLGGLALLPGLFALGFALADLGIAQRLPHQPGRLLAAAAVCAATAVAALLVVYAEPAPEVSQRIGVLFSLSMALGYAALFLVLLRTPLGGPLSAVLAPMGRMALTNYLTATVLFVTVGDALDLGGTHEWLTAAALGAGILLVQAAWSAAWLLSFRYGPLEWLWRCLTYWRLMPMRG